MQNKREIPYTFFMVLTLIFVVMIISDHKRLPEDSDWTSISIAKILLEKKIYSNGYNFNWSEIKIASKVIKNKKATYNEQISKPGYDHPPGYPLFLASMSWFSASAVNELQCYIIKLHDCYLSSISDRIMVVQAIIAMIALYLVFLIARELSNNIDVAVLTSLIVLFTGQFSEQSQLLHPYILITALVLTCCYCSLLAYKSKSITWACISGIFIGLAVLFHPPLALVPLIIISLIPFITLRKERGRHLSLIISLLIGSFIVTMPWLFRNYVLFGEFAFSHAEAYTNLTRRIAYNHMSLSEWFSAFIVWMPGPGESYAHLFIGSDTLKRLGTINEVESIIRGANQFIEPYFKENNSSIIYNKIIYNYVFNDLFNYLTSMLPLFIRGIWGSSNLIGLVGLFFIWPLFKRLKATKNFAPFSLIFAIIIACQLSQTMLSANQPYYSGYLQLIHAYAIAHVSGGLELLPFVRKWVLKTQSL